MSRSHAIKLLDELTKSERISRRSKKLLADPKGSSQSEWYMYVPRAFNEALDIKFELSGPNQGWTQAGCFSFKKEDTLYDTEKAYGKWSDALKEINLSLVIKSATPSGVGENNARYCGSVDFKVYLPDAERKRLLPAFDWKMSQDQFVRLLIEGPCADLKEAITRKSQIS